MPPPDGSVSGRAGSPAAAEGTMTRLLPSKSPALSESSSETYRFATTLAEAQAAFSAAIEEKKIAIGVVTVGSGPHTGHLIGLAVSCSEGAAVFMNFAHPGGPRMPLVPVIALLADVVTRPDVVTVGADIKDAWKWLERAGVADIAQPWDVCVAAHLRDGAREVQLAKLAAHDLGVDVVSVTGGSTKNQSSLALPIRDVISGTCASVDAVLRLYQKYRPRIDRLYPTSFYHIEMPLVRVLVGMELSGVLVDRAHLIQLLPGYIKCKTDAASIINAAARKAGWKEQDAKARIRTRELGQRLGIRLVINPNRDDSVKRLLTLRGVRLIERTRAGAVKLDGDVLDGLIRRHPKSRLLRAVRDYRHYRSLEQTVESLLASINPVTGCIHPTFHQTRARTFRLSCSDPNLQGIPKGDGIEIRHCALPRPGRLFIRIDLNQIELRVLAFQAKDVKMMAAFARGDDLHEETATACLGDAALRDQAKPINFGVIYGRTEVGLARKLGISPRKARRWMRNYDRTYPGIPRYKRRVVRYALRHGHVRTLVGARRYFSQRDRDRSGWKRRATNFPIQASAGEIFKVGMVRVHEAIQPYAARIVLTIHDELVIECPAEYAEEVLAMVKAILEEGLEPLGIKLSVPLVADGELQDRWGRKVQLQACPMDKSPASAKVKP